MYSERIDHLTRFQIICADQIFATSFNVTTTSQNVIGTSALSVGDFFSTSIIAANATITNLNNPVLSSLQTAVTLNSANWIDTYTVVAGASSNWNSTYNTFASNSATYIVAGGNIRNQNVTIGTRDPFHLNFETYDQTRATILSTGEVGIGTTTPNERLTVTNNISAAGVIYSQGGNSNQWNNVFTAYQTTSSSFATNTTVNTIVNAASGLLTPLTTTNTLTGLLTPLTTTNTLTGLLTPLTTTNTLTGLLTPLTTTRTLTGLLTPTTVTNTLTGLLTPLTTTNNLTGLLLQTTVFQNATANNILQNGNSFGQALTIGTNDSNNLNLETAGTARLTILSTGLVTFVGSISSNNTTTSFNQGSATGSRSFAVNNGRAYGVASHAEGLNSTASGNYSHAEGQGTRAAGDSSHAEGLNSTASGNYSHAEGTSTASGDNSHAEGTSTASGTNSHAEGTSTASGTNSHAEGASTLASGTNSHAEGNLTKATGSNSHTEGDNSVASNAASHAEGGNTTASGQYSHTEGFDTVTGAEVNWNTYTPSTRVFTFTSATSARFNYATAGTVIKGFSTPPPNAPSYFYITVLARSTITGNITATSEALGGNTAGYLYDGSGTYGHAEGYSTMASGSASHAEGYLSKASGFGSHAEGSSQASGTYAHAEGATQAGGNYSHAEGYNSVATGIASHAEGYSSAYGDYSHAAGYGAIANHNYTYVWTDGNLGTRTFSTTQPGQYTISASGGVFIPGEIQAGRYTNSQRNILISTSFGASADSFYLVNTISGVVSATLPSTPLTGDSIKFSDPFSTWNTNLFVVNRNGNNIERLAENLFCDVAGSQFTLTFVGSSVGWKVY